MNRQDAKVAKDFRVVEKATRLRLGLLINFNVGVLQRGIKRVVQTQ
jgi:hypothetical protein